MFIIYIYVNEIKISYDVEGEGIPLILLHGWGANKGTFKKLVKELKVDYMVYSIDLPGFGESEIGLPLTVHEVCEYIHEFVVKLKIDNPIILGHSYGGRIGIIYASLYKVRGLVLVSSAGVKAKLNISKRLKIKMYKLFKKVGINVKLGSKDYRDSDNVKRAMLVNAVNTDLTNEMEKINVSTILIYGENDKETPKEIAEYINTHIKNSSLVMMEDCGHFPYLEKPTIFNLILNSFLTGIST